MADSRAATIAAAYPKAGATLAAEIVAVADRVGANPYALANLINFESGFSPTARNPFSGATGLIQFMPTTAAGLGTSTAALATMSAVTQMRYVEAYLRSVSKGKSLASSPALYMAVFYPAAMTWPADRPFSAGVQAQNPGIKTPADYAALVERRAALKTGVGGNVTALAVARDTARYALAVYPWWVWALVGVGVTLPTLALILRRRRSP